MRHWPLITHGPHIKIPTSTWRWLYWGSLALPAASPAWSCRPTCMRPRENTIGSTARLESCMSWHRGVGRIVSSNASYRLPPRLPSATFSIREYLIRAWSVHGRVLVAFWPHARKAGNPQRLIACVDSRLFQASRSFQRLLMQIQGPRRANKTSGCRHSNSTQGGLLLRNHRQ
jgi:hypothetical protein